MAKDNKIKPSSKELKGKERSRKAIERAATFGLILVAAGLLAPFADVYHLPLFKWVYAAGALIFTVARIAGSTDPGESLNLRRLRRLEFWAGVAFCIGAFFWFYGEEHLPEYYVMGMGLLAYLRNTVYFTLAGAVIQVLAVILLANRLKKENNKEQES